LLAKRIELEQRREVQSGGIDPPFDDPIALVVAEPRYRSARVSDFELAAAPVVRRIGDHPAQCVGHRGLLTVPVVRVLRTVAASVGDAQRLIVARACRGHLYIFGRRYRNAARRLVIRVDGL